VAGVANLQSAANGVKQRIRRQSMGSGGDESGAELGWVGRLIQVMRATPWTVNNGRLTDDMLQRTEVILHLELAATYKVQTIC